MRADLLAWDGPSDLVTAGAWAVAVMAARSHPADVLDADVDAAVDVIVADATTAARSIKGQPGYAWQKCLIAQYPNSPATHATAKGKPGVADRIRGLFAPDDPAGQVAPCMVCGRDASAWWDKSRMPMASPRGEVNNRPAGRSGDPVCRWCRVCLWAMPYGAHTTPASVLLLDADGRSVDSPQFAVVRELAGRVAAWMTRDRPSGHTDLGAGVLAASLARLWMESDLREILPLMRWLERQAFAQAVGGWVDGPPLLSVDSALTLMDIGEGAARRRRLFGVETFAALAGVRPQATPVAAGGVDALRLGWTRWCVDHARATVGLADAEGTHAAGWGRAEDLLLAYQPGWARLRELRNDNQRPMFREWTWLDPALALHARLTGLVDGLPERVVVGGRDVLGREDLRTPLARLSDRFG